MEVLVTGLGVICALGSNTQEVIGSFESNTSGMGAAQHFLSKHEAGYVFGEVKESSEALSKRHGFDPDLSRTILLSYQAAKEAFDTIPESLLSTKKIGFISANSVGGMDKTELFMKDYLQDADSADPRQVMNHDCGKTTDFVAEKLGIKDFVTTISTACSSSANAVMLGTRLIRNGLVDIVIAGGVDSLTRFTFNGFNSLMIVDPKQCRPLDVSREGLNLGEGAGYLVLMNEEMARQSGAEVYCRISGYGNTNDAYHQTALSDEGEGPYQAMTQALKSSGILPMDIGYINMHGTGTQNNDSAEGNAITRLFGGNKPKLSSTKSFTGHTLGASGGIEAVLSALSVKRGYVYPTYALSDPIEGLEPETEFHTDPTLEHVLSNSFGFGGNCSSIVFSKN